MSALPTVTEEGKWIRLYPLPLRTLPPENRIRKWDWIDVTLFPHEQAHDRRPESRRPEWDSIRIVDHLDTRDDWSERRKVIGRLPVHPLARWEDLEAKGLASLGVVRPAKVLEVTVSKEKGDEWNTDQKEALRKTNLFSDYQLTLDKIPYAFHVRFVDQDGTEQKLLITDWEIGALYRNCVKTRSPDEAARETARRYFEDVFGESRDTVIFIGTHHRFKFFMAIGIFWPPKIRQMPLF